jgi:glutathione S-transferase
LTVDEPTVYGAAYSVYVRAVRLALEEKAVAYRLVEVDVFAPGGPPAEHRQRHPFGKIPALEHDGFRLYEAGAITRYVDEAFPGPPLQPADLRARARMNQAISVQDSYVYPDLVWGIYVEREAPRRGRASDEARIARLVPKAETCLAALEAIMGDGPWLAGPDLSLADLHAAPMFDLFLRTPEGAGLLPRHARLAAWWRAVSARASFAATAT